MVKSENCCLIILYLCFLIKSTMNNHFSDKRLMYVIIFTAFLNSIGLSIAIPVFAMLFLDPVHHVFGFGLRPDQIMWLLGLLKASYPLFQLIGAPLLGSFSDRIGRKPVLIISLAGTLIGYLLIIMGILSQNLFLLFAGRILDGITGGNAVVLYSAVADFADSKTKTARFGLIGMSFGLGFIFGPFLGGITSSSDIVSWFNYSTPFILASILVLFNLIFIISIFPETREKIKTERTPVSFIPHDYFKLFRSKELLSLFLVFFLFIMGFTFYTQFYDVFLIKKFSFGQRQIGNIFAYIGIWIVLSQGYLTRFFAHKIKAGYLVTLSLFILAASILILLFPENQIWLLLILPFVSVSHGLILPNLLGMISNTASKDLQGKAIGFSQSLQSIGYAIPPLISGFVISLNLNIPILTASVLVGLGFIYFVILLASRKY